MRPPPLTHHRSTESSEAQHTAHHLVVAVSALRLVEVRAVRINRPPTGGDLTFSWKEGHICTVVLLEVLSQPDALAPEAARRAQR